MTLDLGASPFAGQDIPVTRTRKPGGQGVTRRGEILAAAKSLFLEEGFERTTMRRIAAVVGISSTALYVYFADKEAILRAIAEQTFKDLIAFLEASQPAGASALDRFRAGLRAYVAFGRSRPDEYRLTFSTKMIGSPSPGRVREPIEAGSTSFALLKDGIARLIQDGTFASGSPYLARASGSLGCHAAAACAAPAELSLARPGYHFSKRGRSVPSSARVRVCSSRCAPRFVHCIC